MAALEGYSVPWKQADIIRAKADGHPFLVVHIHKNVCTIIIDLLDHSEFPVTRALLGRQYQNFLPDTEMDEQRITK